MQIPIGKELCYGGRMLLRDMFPLGAKATEQNLRMVMAAIRSVYEKSSQPKGWQLRSRDPSFAARFHLIYVAEKLTGGYRMGTHNKARAFSDEDTIAFVMSKLGVYERWLHGRI